MTFRLRFLQTVFCIGAFLALVQRSHAQIHSAALEVKPVPVVDSVRYDCTSGMVQVQVAAPISSASYTIVSTSPAISLPSSNTTGAFTLTGARSATIHIDASGCYTDTTIAFDCGGTPLPVSLLAFSASLYEENKALLEWVASGEEELERYEIEESNDGKSYRTLGSIPVLPGTHPETGYKYVDTSLWRGFNFYRIALRHLDGHTTYSPVRTVFYDYRERIRLAFYPNPTTGNVTAEVQADIVDELMLYVYDQASRLVMSPLRQPIQQGRNLIPLDLSALADGNYLVVYKLPAHQVSGTMRITKTSGY